ncbi:MAG: peptidase [Geobacteraceae bacterium]|nr:MAG: peptidase [Geobacteraceae bacterium]
MVRITVFIIAFVSCLASEPRCADVKEELQDINKEIKEKKLLLKKTRKVETKVSGDLEKIEKSLHEKEANLDSLGRDLKGVETTLERTQNEIEVVKVEAERKKQQISRRLASLYKAGEAGPVRMFFSSESFPQMTENLRYMNSVLQNDRKLFADYNTKIERLGVLKGTLEKDAARKEKIKAGIEVKKQEIEEEKKKKAAHLIKIREDKKSYQASLKELEANARRLQAMVERLEAKSRKSYSKKIENKSGVGADHSLPAIPNKGFGAQKGRLAIPVKGEIIGTFGRHKHPEFNSYTVSNGISIAAPAGTDIHSVYEGQVIFADYFKGYGNMVIVDHGGGFFSLYGHAAKIVKKVGATVARNDVVASVGEVDSTRGPMVYFEIRYQGKPVDPTQWFR